MWRLRAGGRRRSRGGGAVQRQKPAAGSARRPQVRAPASVIEASFGTKPGPRHAKTSDTISLRPRRRAANAARAEVPGRMRWRLTARGRRAGGAAGGGGAGAAGARGAAQRARFRCCAASGAAGARPERLCPLRRRQRGFPCPTPTQPPPPQEQQQQQQPGPPPPAARSDDGPDILAPWPPALRARAPAAPKPPRAPGKTPRATPRGKYGLVSAGESLVRVKEPAPPVVRPPRQAPEEVRADGGAFWGRVYPGRRPPRPAARHATRATCNLTPPLRCRCPPPPVLLVGRAGARRERRCHAAKQS
jgi:hypothetical protein